MSWQTLVANGVGPYQVWRYDGKPMETTGSHAKIMLKFSNCRVRASVALFSPTLLGYDGDTPSMQQLKSEVYMDWGLHLY